MIHLTKEQTLQLFYNVIKQNALNERQKCTTKSQWKCLKCLKTIYVSYKQFSVLNIVCDDCRNLIVNNPTVVQYQYMMALKKKQLDIIESMFGVDFINNELTKRNL